MNLHTTTTVANLLGYAPNYVRRLCAANGIGTLVSNRNRVLTDADIELIKAAIAGKNRGGARVGSGRKKAPVTRRAKR